MSEEASSVMNQETNPEESQKLSHTDDATPDELFESFMEIANNPELHDKQTDMQKDITGEATGASDPCVSEVKDINSSANGERDVVSGQEITNSVSNPFVSQLTDITSCSDEPQTDMQNGTNDQSGATETDQKSTPNGTPDQSESIVRELSDSTLLQAADVNSGTGEQSICAQTTSNVETLDTASDTADDQLNFVDNAAQSTTEGPGAGSEQVLANPVSDETKPEELHVSATSLQSSSDITNEETRTDEQSYTIENLEEGAESSEVGTSDNKEISPEELSATSLQSSSDITNEETRTDEQSYTIENLEEGAESSEVGTSDNKEISPDSTAVEVDCDISSNDEDKSSSGNDPSTSEADVAKRLSKVMMDLAGLEEQLSSVVTEFNRPSSKKSFAENSAEKELNAIAETPEGQTLENQIDEQVASDNTVMDTAEAKVEDENVLKKGAADEESNVLPLQENDVKGGETGVDLNAVTVHPSNDEILVEDTDKICKDAVPVDNVHSESKGTDVDVVEVQEIKMENSVSDNKDIPVNEDTPTNEGTKVESIEVGKSETPDAEVNTEHIADDKEPFICPEESHGETMAKDSNNDAEEKSDCVDKLDVEVAKSCSSIPDIEITTDESGILEDKSLDSLDAEGSSNMSEDGIDSDTPSDYGDDDEDGTFDPDNLGASRKSWLLETDRDRLSSDSSTVSERDFKDSYNKGDNANGKSPKDDYIRGHLLKMGGTGLTPKNWRKRWFVLRRDNCLYYYKQSKDKVPCGVIILANYSVSKAPEVNKDHCLKLTKGGARTYYMCAGSDLDMKKWIMAMTDAIKGSSGSSNPFNLFEGNVHNVSIPALSIRDPDCHGYLFKQGHNIKTWRRRYFVLKNGFLYYYSDMSNTVALGVAKLLNYTIQVGDRTGKKFCFSAVSSEASLRTYNLAAESEMDRTRWLTKLEDSIKKGSLVSC